VHRLVGVEGLEAPHQVGRVEAEIEREVVPSAGRDAHIWQLVAHRHLGHQRLGAVPARHADNPGRLRGLLGQRPQILARLQLDRPDPPRAGLLGEVRPTRPAIPGAGIDQQHGAGSAWPPARGPGRGIRPGGAPCRRTVYEQGNGEHNRLTCTPQQDGGQPARHGGHERNQGHGAPGPAVGERGPPGTDADQEKHRGDHHRQRVGDQRQHRGDERDGGCEEGEERGKPPAHARPPSRRPASPWRPRSAPGPSAAGTPRW